jgi:hypothetical protein
VETPNFSYSSINTDDSPALGNETQAHLGRFPSPEGEAASNKNFIAFSLLLSNGGIVDYDSELFPDEIQAQAYIDALQSDEKYQRKGIIVPMISRAKVETKIINMINTGDSNTNSNHDGALPKSDSDLASSPYYTKAKQKKIDYLKSK